MISSSERYPPEEARVPRVADEAFPQQRPAYDTTSSATLSRVPRV